MRALPLRPPRDPAPYLLASFSATWAFVGFRLGSLRHDRFSTYGFDLGIYDQAIWLLAHGRDPFITVRGIDTFGHHFTPIFWLFAPVSWLGGGPHALLALQIASQVLAALALYLLTVDLLGPALRWLGALFGAAFLLHPTSGWLVWEFFHPEVFALGPLLMAYRAARTQRWVAFLVWGLLAAACKEDLMLALAMIGLSVVLPQPKQRLRGLAIVAGWAVAYVLVSRLIITARAGGVPWWGTFYEPYGDSPTATVVHFLTHPGDVRDVLLDHERMAYFRAILVPAGLVLPILGWRGFAIGLPALFGNIATGPGFPYTRHFELHYSAVVVGAVLLGLVECAASIQRLSQRQSRPRVLRWPARRWPWILAAVVVACSITGYRQWGVGPGSKDYRRGPWPFLAEETTASVLLGRIDVDAYGNTSARTAALRLIPSDTPVSAHYLLDAHLTHREAVYEWPNPWINANWGFDRDGERQGDPTAVEYLVLDPDLTFGNPGAQSEGQVLEAELFRQLTAGEFEVIFERDGVALARRRRPAACFAASEALARGMAPTYRIVGEAAGGRRRVCPIESSRWPLTSRSPASRVPTHG